jgi:hypothetical protein
MQSAHYSGVWDSWQDVIMSYVFFRLVFALAHGNEDGLLLGSKFVNLLDCLWLLFPVVFCIFAPFVPNLLDEVHEGHVRHRFHPALVACSTGDSDCSPLRSPSSSAVAKQDSGGGMEAISKTVHPQNVVQINGTLLYADLLYDVVHVHRHILKTLVKRFTRTDVLGLFIVQTCSCN